MSSYGIAVDDDFTVFPGAVSVAPELLYETHPFGNEPYRNTNPFKIIKIWIVGWYAPISSDTFVHINQPLVVRA